MHSHFIFENKIKSIFFYFNKLKPLQFKDITLVILEKNRDWHLLFLGQDWTALS